MMEVLDIYDDNGDVTGKTIVRGDKSVKLKKHEHIAVAVIFIENDKEEFLIQETSLEKGGEFSSTGGHVLHGETPLDAIKREVLEELGINIYGEWIMQYGYLNYDMPLRYMFYLKKNIDINDVNLQKEEVESVKWMKIEEIKKLIDEDKMLKSHGIMFEEMLRWRDGETDTM